MFPPPPDCVRVFEYRFHFCCGGANKEWKTCIDRRVDLEQRRLRTQQRARKIISDWGSSHAEESACLAEKNGKKLFSSFASLLLHFCCLRMVFILVGVYVRTYACVRACQCVCIYRMRSVWSSAWNRLFVFKWVLIVSSCYQHLRPWYLYLPLSW